jgi:hypothetical protein
MLPVTGMVHHAVIALIYGSITIIVNNSMWRSLITDLLYTLLPCKLQENVWLSSAYIGNAVNAYFLFLPLTSVSLLNSVCSKADSPDPKRIPILLLTCAYRGQEFARIGYYINNEYIDPELKENPPEKTDFQKVCPFTTYTSTLVL